MANLKAMGRQSGPGLASFNSGSRRMGSRSWAARGFTLIELMIVIAVIGVLLAIAYPSYQDAVRKSRRGQAKADLVAAAHNMERFHTENNTYDGAPVLLSSTPHYTIDTAAPPTQGTFTLVATPNGDQEQDRCGNLQLDHAGVRMHSEGDDVQCEFGTLGP